jgi:hypothetical protein
MPRREHLIAVCRECGARYDIDLEPPLFCHDDDCWDVEVRQVED